MNGGAVLDIQKPLDFFVCRGCFWLKQADFVKLPIFGCDLLAGESQKAGKLHGRDLFYEHDAVKMHGHGDRKRQGEAAAASFSGNMRGSDTSGKSLPGLDRRCDLPPDFGHHVGKGEVERAARTFGLSELVRAARKLLTRFLERKAVCDHGRAPLCELDKIV